MLVNIQRLVRNVKSIVSNNNNGILNPRNPTTNFIFGNNFETAATATAHETPAVDVGSLKRVGKEDYQQETEKVG